MRSCFRSMSAGIISAALLSFGLPFATAIEQDFSPQPSEQQLPYSMRSAMEELPKSTVGQQDADLIGTDNRVLQAARSHHRSLCVLVEA
ncbi:hypothetical protein [Novipirellula artificiosorum]|uniref:SCP domain-containing protein n=1 Tax=Novipirellula artificiosorum TaxID=2528016 RepID=A0A5C6D8J7_9BACT|nr:hypothetical protein [Novipirellula artificiosorum]TWU31179.1 hypothetical protein Poly41_63700 [Novipirellula artificiosorum]